MDGGGDIDQIFDLSRRYLGEVDTLRTSEDLIFWLTRIMERFSELVFNLVDIKHKDIIYKAIEYIKRGLPRKDYAGRYRPACGAVPLLFQQSF